MQAIDNYGSVQESHGGVEILPPGGYVCTIVRVTDKPDERNKAGEVSPRLEVVFDVSEGDYAGFFAEESKNPGDDWKHTLELYYGGRAKGRFKAFDEAVKASNPGFAGIEAYGWDERCYVDKLVGLVIGHRLYTAGPKSNNPGADRTALTLSDSLAVAEVRAGNFKVPAVQDQRKGVRPVETKPGPIQADAYLQPATAALRKDESIPF